MGKAQSRSRKHPAKLNPPTVEHVKQMALAREIFPDVLVKTLGKDPGSLSRPEIRDRAYRAAVASVLAAKVYLKTLKTWAEREKESAALERGGVRIHRSSHHREVGSIYDL